MDQLVNKNSQITHTMRDTKFRWTSMPTFFQAQVLILIQLLTSWSVMYSYLSSQGQRLSDRSGFNQTFSYVFLFTFSQQSLVELDRQNKGLQKIKLWVKIPYVRSWDPPAVETRKHLLKISKKTCFRAGFFVPYSEEKNVLVSKHEGLEDQQYDD